METPRLFSLLQSARHRHQRLKTRSNHVRRQSQTSPDSDCAHDVLQIGCADERRRKIEVTTLELQLSSKPSHIALDFYRVNVPLVLLTIAPSLQARVVDFAEKLRCAGVSSVHTGSFLRLYTHFQLIGKKLALSQKIVVHARMVIEMIAGQIRE